MENPYSYTPDQPADSSLARIISLVQFSSEVDVHKVLLVDLRVICRKQNSLEWRLGGADMWAGPDWGAIGTVSDENIQALSEIGIEVIRQPKNE